MSDRRRDLRAIAPGVALAQDRYRDVRGGHSAQLLVVCAGCDRELFLYQKDGDGPLLRCYLNRVHVDPNLERRVTVEAGRTYRCVGCSAALGEASTYEDGRPAIALAEASVRTTVLREEPAPGS